MGSASGDRRENRDFVPVRDRVVASDIILVDRDPHYREIAQRFGIGGGAPAQPIEQPGPIAPMLGGGGVVLRVGGARGQAGKKEKVYGPNTPGEGGKKDGGAGGG